MEFIVQNNGNFSSPDSGQYVHGTKNEDVVILDGEFTTDDLDHIISLMKDDKQS